MRYSEGVNAEKMLQSDDSFGGGNFGGRQGSA